jgi:hypothetical protein
MAQLSDNHTIVGSCFDTVLQIVNASIKPIIFLLP